MDCVDKTALFKFTARWLKHHHSQTKNESLQTNPSPCLLKVDNNQLFWQPSMMNPSKNLDRVAHVVGINIHSSAHVFYGSQYAADMQAEYLDIMFTLIQIWNDDDFFQLEQNVISHLLMQKKLKRTPTIFIGTTNDNSKIISLNNVTGAILYEDLITGNLRILHDNMAGFLTNVSII